MIDPAFRALPLPPRSAELGQHPGERQPPDAELRVLLGERGDRLDQLAEPALLPSWEEELGAVEL